MIDLLVSPSKLEQFRKFRDESMGGVVTEEKLIESLTTKTPPSDPLKLGLAYHEILEYGHKPYEKNYNGEQFYKVTGKRIGEIGFTKEQIIPAIRLRNKLQDATFEVPLQCKIQIGNYNILSRQRADALLGLELHEFKTTSSKYTPRYIDYYQSIQWRFYMMSLPDAQKVNYTVFHFKNQTRRRPRRKAYFKGEFRTVTDYKFTMPKEKQNDEIVLQYLDEFLSFCERQGLIENLILKDRF